VSAAADEPRHDGRHARRERNRDAVVAALLALYHEGDLDPPVERIAARSGVSARSLFRYFDDVDDLCRSAIAAQLGEVLPILDRVIESDAPFDMRVRAVVAQRADLFETVGRVGVIARVRAPFQPLVAAQLQQVRGVLRDAMAAAFAPELDRVDPEQAATALAAADVACSYETHELLRTDRGLDRAATVAVREHAVAAAIDVAVEPGRHVAGSQLATTRVSQEVS
jgi:AcrR family transcriptional regulator